jgi:Dolichyl-phosphate-mannose-protein mannosyltransferase
MMRFALGGLPLISFLVWSAALYLLQKRRDPQSTSLRNTILQAAALFGLWVMLGTEGLSAVNQLKFVPILLWWIVALAAGIVAVCRLYDHALVPRIQFSRPKVMTAVLTVVAGLPFLAILLLAFGSAFFNPPNNYDSYSYHLPRQVFWLQHANVAFYSTNNLRQLMMAPFSEFVGTNLMALSNSDRWTNLVQFAALIVTFCGVSLLTERLGGNRAVQLLACLILLASPVVFMEASNTKNDMVVGMWIIICTCWLIRVLDGATLNWLDALLFGSAIGCAADTKGTGPLFVLPIVAVLSIAMLRRFTLPRFKTLAAIGLVGLAINLPQFARNARAFGHIDGPPPDHGGYPIYNVSHGLNVVISNIARQLAWTAAVRYQPFDDAMYLDVVWLHQHVLGLDTNDPRTTTIFSAYKGLIFRGDDEDRAGAPFHILLLCLLPMALVIARRKIDLPYALLLCGLSIAGFVIFNWCLKWEEWNVRYFIPQTALFAPVLAAAFCARWRALTLPILVGALAFLLIPTIVANPRHLIGPGNLFERDDLSRRLTYIGHDQELTQLAKLVSGRKMHWVGLATNGNFPDYAVMYVVRRRMKHPPGFEYVNPFVKIAGDPARPADVVVADLRLTSLTDRQTGVRYRLYSRNSLFNVWLPESDPAP